MGVMDAELRGSAIWTSSAWCNSSISSCYAALGLG